jgi:hypothetical protein
MRSTSRLDLSSPPQHSFTSLRGETKCQQPRRHPTKAMMSRFDDAMNTGDAEVISKTIDELVEPT